jgi:hypothetical protein
MRVVELQKILTAADAAAVLVSPQIMERVLRETWKLPSIYVNPPHRKTCVANRQTLYRHAEQVDLELEPDILLPETVILLVRPENDALSPLETPNLLLKYWRWLFHARVHLALAHLPPATVRERIEAIGRTDFDAFRAILAEDGYLAPNANDGAVYTEFAAVFLELRYFSSARLAAYFPGVAEINETERIVANDFDPPLLFRQTRLKGAPDPVAVIEKRTTESEEGYWTLVRSAQRASARGNMVRAAILNMRAARIAPAAKTLSTREQAEKLLHELIQRLSTALGLPDVEVGQWYGYTALLLDRADQGSRPAEARLLEDLQTVCVDSEQSIYTLDLAEWLLSGFRRPMKRPLPSQRMVRIVKQLRAVANRIPLVRLSDADRDVFGGLVHAALKRCEESLRLRFRPVLVAAFEDAGLKATNPPEKAAFEKMVEELLDRILALGFFTFSDLRDTISRNQIKLPDLVDPQEVLRGDALIRLNARLTTLLDGVYRPGELYMRLLEWVTAWGFGTKLGRFLTRTVTIPVGASLLVMHTLGILVSLTGKYLLGHPEDPQLTHISHVLLGPWHDADGEDAGRLFAGQLPSLDTIVHFALWGASALFVLGLVNSSRFRRRVLAFLGRIGHALRRVLWDLPLGVLPMAEVERFLKGWSFQLLLWFVIQPLAVCAILAYYRPQLFRTIETCILVFLIVFTILISRIGRVIGQLVWQSLVSMSTALQAGLLRGLISFIVQLFKRIIDLLEYLLFTVEEWLRFRTGESGLSMGLKAILGLVWFPFAYVARLYTVVLIEPGLNPIKAPVSIMAGKFLVPILPSLTTSLTSQISQLLGSPADLSVVRFIVLPTMFLLPDAFGFLFWEIKENWSMFRANRPKNLEPVSVGAHGETVRGLLQPGFHSGTVPRLFRHLRYAERHSQKTNDWTTARLYRREIEETAHSIERFVSRELVGLLRQSHTWQTLVENGSCQDGVCVPGSASRNDLEAGSVRLTTNRIGFALHYSAYPATPVRIEVERCGGRWLVACVREVGWLVHLSAEPIRAFTAALAGWYKLAGIDLVREQIRANLPPQVTTIEIVSAGIQVWIASNDQPAIYDLSDPIEPIHPRAGPAAELPTLDASRLLFAQTPVSWKEWVQCWVNDQVGQGHPGLPGLGEQLVTIPRPTTTEESTNHRVTEDTEKKTEELEKSSSGAA